MLSEAFYSIPIFLSLLKSMYATKDTANWHSRDTSKKELPVSRAADMIGRER